MNNIRMENKMNIICILASGVGNRFGSSIPKQYHSNYMNDMIGIRIYDLMRYLDNHPFSISWHKSEFYIELACDIDNYGCQTTRANLLILKSHNLFIQFLMVSYKKLRKIFQK